MRTAENLNPSGGGGVEQAVAAPWSLLAGEAGNVLWWAFLIAVFSYGGRAAWGTHLGRL
jgi:hypothetical protein